MLVKAVPVALCVDRRFLPGLHVTLFTAASFLQRDAKLLVYIFSDSLTESDYGALEATLVKTGRSFSLERRTVDISRFKSLPWQGGWMTYARLVVPDDIPWPRFVFLDADLIVLADLTELVELDLEDNLLGAVSWGRIDGSQDRNFFSCLGFDLSKPYFNAGVLLIDGERWKTQRMSEQCLRLAFEYGERLPAMDQTVLNLAFYDSFLPLPRRFNTTVSANRAPLGPDQIGGRIIHLVSYPKPWDPLGILNGQFFLFKFWLERTTYRYPWKFLPDLRTLRKIRSIAKCLPNLIRNFAFGKRLLDLYKGAWPE